MKRRNRTPAEVLGRLLKDIRKEANLTQEEVATHLGFEGATIITRIETGQRAIRLWEFVEFSKFVEQDPTEVFAEYMRDLAYENAQQANEN